MEIKLNANRMKRVRRRCGFFNGIDLAAEGSRGGLSLGWNGGQLVNLKSFSKNHIDMEIQEEENPRWWFTGFYGNPEKKGGNLREEARMEAFHRTLEDRSLGDIGFSGSWFTWERGQTLERNIREIIDRGVAMNSWIQNFPNYLLRHLPHSFSDHCPLLIETEFKHKSKIQRLNRRIEELNGEESSEGMLAKLVEVKLHLNMEIDKEERYWEQRVRVNWLQMGDKNTLFFHKNASQRRLFNRIRGLQRIDGSVTKNEKEIDEITRRYFTDLFESRGVGDVTHILSGVKSCMSESRNQNLMVPYTEMDIIEALKGMGPTKAAGAERCIDDAQSAFVPGRLITDNVLLAYEILHSLKNKRSGQKGLMALKLDMSKAYDRVEWPFIKGVMSKLGFAENFIELIIRCLNSVWYSILINGEEGLSFRSTRDDCILFGEASNRGASLFKDILTEYEACWGQCVNFEKSTVFFSSNVTDQDRNLVFQVLGVRCSNDPEKYLGLPNMVGCKRKLAFQVLKDRLKQRVNSWSIKYISQGALALLRNPNSLLARTLEAKYYKDSDFLKSELGNLPSFTWKSVWAAKGLLLQGMGWRIGDGQKVAIWNDKWVPGNEALNGQNSSINFNLEKVADLFEPNTRKWNEDLILNTFTVRDTERILCIPLCHMEAETKEHLFRDCPVTKETWESLDIVGPASEQNMEFTEWLRKFFEVNSLGMCRKFVCALWGIWTFRNKLIHKDEIKIGIQIADFISNYLKELDGVKQILPERRVYTNRWKAPAGMRLKINFDATFNRQRNESCSGLVIRNGKAEVLCSKTIINKNIPSVFATNALACYQAIDLGFQLGLWEVEIEGDARTVIRKLQEKKEDRSKIAAYIKDSKEMVLQFRYCVFLFQNREANEVAHKIASKGLKRKGNNYLSQRVPTGAESAVMEDRRWTENEQETRRRSC
ncbi:reverse transcriptase [Gossypium australe]|uniref:Reverse transcriptase n=1 Tax=Gossypium australe TaxID=47621 RepID=A0A5B6WQH0_9ROSI|nr:reverse transcriptase [Gossypium australe]